MKVFTLIAYTPIGTPRREQLIGVYSDRAAAYRDANWFNGRPINERGGWAGAVVNEVPVRQAPIFGHDRKCTCDDCRKRTCDEWRAASAAFGRLRG